MNLLQPLVSCHPFRCFVKVRTMMRRFCLKTSEATGRLGITSSSDEGFTSLCSDLTPFRMQMHIWYEIKSRDKNEKGKNFIFYNKPYTFSRPSWSIAHGVCTLSLLPAPTPALDLHTHTQCVHAVAQ